VVVGGLFSVWFLFFVFCLVGGVFLFFLGGWGGGLCLGAWVWVWGGGCVFWLGFPLFFFFFVLVLFCVFLWSWSLVGFFGVVWGGSLGGLCSPFSPVGCGFRFCDFVFCVVFVCIPR